ncbi:MAG: glycosyltransferase [Gammaproteobacteria bacterium]|nr:glycosyltransferase [Gammaproteobacteria bacterium]MDH5799241.1 glycosyltransferase [Gammaproteobacteria bacterium]
MTDRIWITWENQRRNRTLSRHLQAKLFQLDYKLSRPLRYPVVVFLTMFIILREWPRTIFVQNPSFLLALFAVVLGRLFHKPIIVDAHYAGLFPMAGNNKLLNTITRFITRNAYQTIVTTEDLKQHVESLGGRAFVIPDPLPQFPNITPNKKPGTVLFICTWADDEPYLEIIKAAEKIDPTICIYITGNSKGREKLFGKDLPPNIILTGYISEEEFVNKLFESDLVIDLTTRENCLVCGAYEAIGAGTPLLLSNSVALQKYFGNGAVFTDNTAADIADKISFSISNKNELQQKITVLKKELVQTWNANLAEFEKIIAD